MYPLLIPLQNNFEGVFVLYYPSLSECLSMKATCSFIPVTYKVWSDNVTPIRLFQQVKGQYSFLLESVEGGEKWARYSFIGNNPFLLFSVVNKKAKIKSFRNGISEEQEIDGDPIEILKGLLKKYQVPKGLDIPRFSGGAVGYMGYDAVSILEEIPSHQLNPLQQDQMRFMFCDEIIAFDHLKQEITFISHLPVNEHQADEELEKEYHLLCNKIAKKAEELLAKLQNDSIQLFRLPEGKPDVDWERVTSNFTKNEFLGAVNQVKEYIRAGDVFQTVLSQRFSMEIETDPFDIYRTLRLVNPSPYLYYLDLGEGYQLVGSSPERLVQLEEGNVETNPIAGTRHRGKSTEEDDELARELLADEKERAEHHMLLDLGRNDIGRISEFGTVKVSKKMEIERFSHVMHIVSTVQGQMKKGLDAVDCLVACFPAGTVSGAPKVRALEIIAELEKEARNSYAGAIGYFSFSGNLDSCITIRTIVVHNGKAYVQAGAGIVADSVPENEWMETRNKARALLIAIQMAEKIFEKKVNVKNTDEGESVHV
jgi:anthranilate synthase component 1